MLVVVFLWGLVIYGVCLLAYALVAVVVWDTKEAFRRWRQDPPPPPRVKTSEELRKELRAYEDDCYAHGVQPYGEWS